MMSPFLLTGLHPCAVDGLLAPTGLTHVRLRRHEGSHRHVGDDHERGSAGLSLNGRTAVGFAMEGKHFALIRTHFPEEYHRMRVSTAVFARMSPDQKAQLIEDLQSIVRPSTSSFTYVSSFLNIIIRLSFHVPKCLCLHYSIHRRMSFDFYPLLQ